MAATMAQAAEEHPTVPNHHNHPHAIRRCSVGIPATDTALIERDHQLGAESSLTPASRSSSYPSPMATKHHPKTPNCPAVGGEGYFVHHSHYRSPHLKTPSQPTSNPSSSRTSSTSLNELGEEADTVGPYQCNNMGRARSAQGSRSRSRRRHNSLHSKSPSLSNIDPSRTPDEHTRYSDQPSTVLYSQRAAPPLRTRSSHPSQTSLHMSFSTSPRSSRDRTNPSQGARTAGNTPVSSPGLFPPRTPHSATPATVPESTATHSNAQLHSSHLLTPKETFVAEVDHDVFTGNKVINGYVVVTEIGRGAHGRVKLGQNLETGTRVAMKIVPRFSSKRRLGKLGAPEDRVKKEVAILKKARHRNVVSLLEVIDDPSKRKVYIVLEYVEHGEIRWRKKGLRQIILINNRRLEFERQGRGETTETFEQDMLIMRQVSIRRRRVLDSSQRTDQNSIPCWVPPYMEDEEGESESQTVDGVISKIPYRSGRVGLTSNENADVPSSDGGAQDRSSHNGKPFIDSLVYTSTASHVSSERWDEEEEDDERSYVPTLTLAEAKSAFRDTLLGLEFLHFQGIIHRDIKPANLLVASDGHVKISDFGVSYLGKPLRDDEHGNLSDKLSEKEAKEMDDPRLLAKTVGTPAFYAPELIYWDTDIFEGGKPPTITGAIDLWALGVTLYCMLYGRLPFLGDRGSSLFEEIMREEVFLPKQRLKPVHWGQDSQANSQEQLDQLRSGLKRADHELVYEDVPENACELIRLLLIKDPAHRVSIEKAKMHPWVVEGIENPGRWIGDTDPKRTGEERIVVSELDLSHAVVKKTVLERAIDGVKGIAGTLMTKARESRRRATSVTTMTSTSAESIVSLSGSSGATVGKDKNSRLSPRASVRGDEITTALKASRDGEHHPLAQSQVASPADRSLQSDSDPDILAQEEIASSAGSSPRLEPERTSRPHGPERVLSASSTADSTRTIRAPQPKPGRSNLLGSGHQELHTPNLFESTATSIGNIFSGAGKRLSSMRSRERRPLNSSRSSSTDGRCPEGTGHAEPSVAVSNATASGNVTTPEALRADVSLVQDVSPLMRPVDPISPQPRRMSLFQPLPSSVEAFEHAQEMNRRRQKLEADIDAERAASRAGLGKASLDCPPSPDDEVYHRSALDVMEAVALQNPLSNQPSASTIASSAAADNGGISQSTSHPSIPSVDSGASSVYPEEASPLPRKGPSHWLEEGEAQSLMSTGDTIVTRGKALTTPAGGILQNGSLHRASSDQDDGSSEDEGLTFGRPCKEPTANQTIS